MKALRNLPELFEVVGVAEPNPAWLEKRSNLPGYEGLPFLEPAQLLEIPGLEAVAIETDGDIICQAAQQCADRSLHLHMDKPGGQDWRAFQHLVQTCRDHSLALQLAYIYRYNPALKFIRDAVRNGWLGDIFEIHAVMSRDDSNNASYRKWLSQFQGGAYYIFAGYLIDFTVSLLGAPERAFSFLKRTRNDTLVDSGLGILEYPVATASLRVSVAEIEGFDHRRVIVCGTNGSAELCPIESKSTNYYTQHLPVRLTLKEPKGDYPAGTTMVDCGVLGDRYAGQLTEFAQIVRGEKTNPFDYDHELLVQRLLLETSGVECERKV